MVTKKISECQSALLSVILEHPSIRRLLQQQFLNASVAAFSPTDTTALAVKKIPLYRLKHPTKFIYRCSLALRLASQLSLSTTAIAQQLVTHLMAVHATPKHPHLEFTLELGENGVIDCLLCDHSLVFWLDRFPKFFCLLLRVKWLILA